MPSTLNIRDIGAARKSALEAEARRRGVAVAEVVRDWIDEGLQRAESDRQAQAWRKAARQGLADEARHLAEQGPTLSRFRKPVTSR